ncbi:MAG: DUF998 domain-containing protein [Flavobacteriaceae bacterium]|nr:DUF998 domain-containing protein [Flavobacteriaceae bacterium]
MNNRLIFFIGILGVILFTTTSIVGGLLIENYSITSQYISETFAIDTEYGLMLRVLGHIPSGILFVAFSFLGYKYFPASNLTKIGFYGIGLFYGIGTIVVAIFPCDMGCNKEFIDPSLSQVIHNLMALLVYTLVPISIIMIGFGLKKSSNNRRFSITAISLGVLSILFVCLLISDPKSEYLGLYQRIIELLFLIWIIICAFKIKNTSSS